MKTLHNTDASGTERNVPDVKKWGNPDAWKLLCKASSEYEGWMKSTKAMQVHGGVLVQTTTQQRNPDGSYSIADALAFVPNAVIGQTPSLDMIDTAGRQIVAPASFNPPASSPTEPSTPST